MAMPTKDPQNTAGPTLTDLVADWISLDQAAELLGLRTSQVRRQVREGQLVAVPVVGRQGLQLPALCIADGQVVKGLSGTLTLLADARYDAREALVWLFTADASLPGRPIDALRDNRGAEVRRRAQALR